MHNLHTMVFGGKEMGRYIYGKYDQDSFTQPLKNEFHYLSIYIGAYLYYCESSQNSSTFSEYIERKGMETLDDKTQYWHYVNKAQSFIRERVQHHSISKKGVSKRQIRKLGYSGCFSRPRLSRRSIDILTELNKLVFSSLKNEDLTLKWENNSSYPISHCITKKHGGLQKTPAAAVDVTRTRFCGFLSEIINSDNIARSNTEFTHAFREHVFFCNIQQEIERRCE